MTIIIFIIILAVLILVHEFGHFIVARKFGIRVDEFGIGFPPKLLSLFKWKETEFTLNAIPFGGFVKIFGEDPDNESIEGPDRDKSFALKNRAIQAAVLFAGVFFNILFAWILFSVGFIYGMPAVLDEPDPTGNSKLMILNVLPNSPAEKAGISMGDEIISVTSGENILEEINPLGISNFINQSQGEITISLLRDEEEKVLEILPTEGIIKERIAIGVDMGYFSILKLPIHEAFWEGTKRTGILLYAVTIGLWEFLSSAVLGKADFSQIAGPVGIVGLVGDASNMGFIYLVNFTAIISLNLAIINLIPIPALDGGRLFFVLIEAISRKRINPSISNTLNALGFLILIGLMVVVTFFDISRLFG